MPDEDYGEPRGTAPDAPPANERQLPQGWSTTAATTRSTRP